MLPPLTGLSREMFDELTDSMSDSQISALYGYSRTAATYARKRLGVKSYSEKHGTRIYKDHYEPNPNHRRAYSFRKSGANVRFFETLSTPRQAYWLGLLYADGWIVTEKQQVRGVALALHQRDEDLLREFAQDLGCPQLVRPERADSSLLQVKVKATEMAEDLVRLGMVPRKSKVITMPRLAPELRPHFLRGYYDGDGCIHVRGNSLTMQITSGSEAMLLDIQKHLQSDLSVGSTVSKDRGSCVIRFYAANAILLGDYLYGNPPHQEISMTRKREKFFDYQGSGAGHSWRQLLSDRNQTWPLVVEPSLLLPERLGC
jgi:hypothetical protein